MTKNKSIILYSLLSTLGVASYTSAVAWLMFNGNAIFGKEDSSFLMPMLFLLLFIISATITGFLVLGRPIYLYFNGQKMEAVKTLGLTLLFLVLVAIKIIILLYIFGHQSEIS